jgi:hypothetical protein
MFSMGAISLPGSGVAVGVGVSVGIGTAVGGSGVFVGAKVAVGSTISAGAQPINKININANAIFRTIMILLEGTLIHLES